MAWEFFVWGCKSLPVLAVRGEYYPYEGEIGHFLGAEVCGRVSRYMGNEAFEEELKVLCDSVVEGVVHYWVVGAF